MSNLRKGEILIPFLTFISDIIVIEGAFLLSYWLRFYSPLVNWIPVTKGFPSFSIYLESSIVLVFVWFYIFHRFGMYGARRNATPVDETGTIVKAVTQGMFVLMAVSFFYRGFSYSRVVFVLIWAVSILLLTGSRILMIFLERWRHRRKQGLLEVAIIGGGEPVERIIENLKGDLWSGFHIKGYIGEMSELSQVIPRLGRLDDLPQIVREQNINVLLLSPNGDEQEFLWRILKMSEGLDVEFLLIPDLLEMMTHQLRVVQFGGVPVLRIKDVRVRGWSGISKRIFDFVLSLILMIVFSPLFFILALIVKFDSKGPVFFKQERLGYDGKKFRILKFRTMIPEAEKKTGPVWTVESDPRRTRSGRFLRRTSLDELPQLINVLRGDMSLVGPRPERDVFVEQFKDKVPRYLERHRVKSGMTGWAQVNGMRGNTPIEERTKYDVFYVENWSLAFDIKILLKTVSAVISGKNSY